MSEEFITIILAIQGEPVVPADIPLGVTLSELKVIKELPEGMEFRVKGTAIAGDFVFGEDMAGKYLVGTRDAKGA
jgi:hypothetical protein